MGPIEYIAVARGPVVLVSHQETEAHFDYLLEQVLRDIPTGAEFKTTRPRGGFTFHLLVGGDLIYACATSTDTSLHLAFQCLAQVKQRFSLGSLPVRAQTAEQHELDRDFESVAAEIARQCNEGKLGDHISKLNRQVDDVKGIMAQNIEKVVERGDRLESLLEKTQELEEAGTAFRSTAKKVNRHMCLRNARMTIIIGVVVVGVVVIIVLFATGVIKT